MTAAAKEHVAEPRPSAVVALPTAVTRGVRRRRRRNARDAAIGVLSVALFLAFWEYAERAELTNPLFISSPTRIMSRFVEMLRDGSYQRHLWASAKTLLIGYFLGTITGVAIGIWTGWSRIARAALSPFMTAGYVTPRIALIPLVIIWFGIGLTAKVFMVFLMIVFPTAITVMQGVRSIDARWTRVARAFGANRRRLFLSVAIPGSVPFIITAMSLGVGFGLIGIIVGELYASNIGLGYLIKSAGATYETDRMFVGVLSFVGLGLIGIGVVRAVNRYFARRWQADAFDA